MAWTLHLLVWITVVSTTAYKYPLNTHQLQFAPIPLDPENQQNFRPSPDCVRLNQRSSEDDLHDSRMNERSIAPSNFPKNQEEVRVYQTRVEDVPVRRSENGSSKILNTVLKNGRRRGQVDNNQITFPGPTASPSLRSALDQDVPESCRRSTFCENVPGYPQEEIDQIISRLGDAVHSLSVDKLDIPETPEITQRLGPTEENLELCVFEEKVVYPQKAKGPDGKWYTLINRRENPVQGFRVEICKQDESSCLGYAVFMKGYTGRCKQKYVYRTASVVDFNDGTPEAKEKLVKLPSCCTCVARTV